MNDFTKEELQEIKRCVKHMISGDVTPYSCFTISVNKKLRSMIENYCDHDTKKYEISIDGEIEESCVEAECCDCNKILI
jgi:hypothetical protein